MPASGTTFHFPVHWEGAEWLPASSSTSSGKPGDWRASELEVALTSKWQSLHGSQPSPFKYQLGSQQEPLETRRLPGPLGLIAQKAVGRAGKRKPPAALRSVAPSERDKSAFGFGDARWRELVLAVDGPPVAPSHPLDLQEMNGSAPLVPRVDKGATARLPAHSVLVNVAPFCAFHFVLATDLARQLPQVLTERSLAVALSFIRHFSNFTRLTFNSLGAGASVNHLHWQGMYLREPLPIERQPRKLKANRGAILLEAVSGWPLGAWAVVADCRVEPDEVAAAVFPLIRKLLERNLAHNLCLVHNRGLVQLFLFVRRLKNFPDTTRAQVASTEVLGYWIVPSQEEYESLTEQDAASRMASVGPGAEGDANFVQDVLAKEGWQFDNPSEDAMPMPAEQDPGEGSIPTPAPITMRESPSESLTGTTRELEL